MALTAEAVEALAEAADGYRTLDGWLARLALTARLERRPLDRGLVAPFLADDASPPAPTIDQVARAVATQFGVTLRDLRATTRRKTVVEPRHLAMHLARSMTGLSFQAIGAYFGGRDPATVRHACDGRRPPRRRPRPGRRRRRALPPLASRRAGGLVPRSLIIPLSSRKKAGVKGPPGDTESSGKGDLRGIPGRRKAPSIISGGQGLCAARGSWPRSAGRLF